MRTGHTLALALTFSLATGCGSSHERPRGDAGPGTGDGSVPRDSGRRDAGPIPAVDAGSRSCGGFAEETCRADEWCDFPDGSFCGGDDTSGVCRPRPEGCDLLYDPVCGCDGNTYGNECAANGAGVDVASRGECMGGATACTNDFPCAAGLVCVGTACGTPWTCIATTRPCTDDAAPHCGCDGVTFRDSSTCQAEPYAFMGACEDGIGCDHRTVLCDALPPSCPPGQVPSAQGGCWGPCVDPGYCTCTSSAECPAGVSCDAAAGRCTSP